MSYKYNPTVTDMRNAYLVAYGDNGAYNLIGAMFANLDSDTVERLYAETLDKVRADMKDLEVVK